MGSSHALGSALGCFLPSRGREGEGMGREIERSVFNRLDKLLFQGYVPISVQRMGIRQKKKDTSKKQILQLKNVAFLKILDNVYTVLTVPVR